MAAISMNASTDNQTLYLYAATDSTYQSINLLATVRSLRTDTAGDLLPSPVINEGIQPPIPKGLQPDGYVIPNFDYLTLPRLELQPTETLVSNVERTELIVTTSEGLVYDLSNHFINGDYSLPISGSSVGSVQVGELGIEAFNISDLNLKYGDRLLWRQCWGNVCLTIANCYILATPTMDTDGGFLKYTINIGDELALKSDTSRVPVSQYCGSPPLFAGQAAAIYADTHNLITKVFPQGHALLDRNLQDFTNESPFDFLSALYAPTNHDVRTDENGIIVRARPAYDAARKITLSKQQVIEVEANFTQEYKPINKVRCKNDYTLINDFETVKTTEKTISGIPSNMKPWFQGGYSETITDKAFWGDTEVWSKVVTYGYIPTGTVTESQYSEDPCDPTTIPVEFGVISTKIISKEYVKHISGAYLVTSEKDWFYTKEMEKVSTLYYVRDNLKEYSTTTYSNTPQINSDVCAKDYIHFATFTRKETYQLAPDFVGYILISDEITEYKVKGVSSLNQSSFVGSEQTWVKSTTVGAYDSDDMTFVIQPVKVEEVATPPISAWIRPSLSDIVAFRTVTLGSDGSLETKPLEAPYCYTDQQLEVFGLRYLRETYGLSLGLSLVVPFYLTINIGDSVSYENNPYVVFNIEVNQTLSQATKTLILCRWID